MTLDELTGILAGMAQDFPQNESRPDRIRDAVGRLLKARRDLRLVWNKARKDGATVIAGLAEQALNGLEAGA